MVPSEYEFVRRELDGASCGGGAMDPAPSDSGNWNTLDAEPGRFCSDFSVLLIGPYMYLKTAR